MILSEECSGVLDNTHSFSIREKFSRFLSLALLENTSNSEINFFSFLQDEIHLINSVEKKENYEWLNPYHLFNGIETADDACLANICLSSIFHCIL